MAGVPGKSGGRRANTGGARAGAGRKKKESSNIIADAHKHSDPKEFLLIVMNNMSLDDRLRIDAAKALMPFMHTKRGEGGKKDERQEAAKNAGRGKFQATAAPRLVVNNK
jgi:phage terminase small subunit